MTARDLLVTLDEIVIEGAPVDQADRIRAMVEAVAEDLGRRLSEGHAGALHLSALRLEITEAGGLLAPGAAEAIARRIERALLDRIESETP